MERISYERCVYESVDDRSLFLLYRKSAVSYFEKCIKIMYRYITKKNKLENGKLIFTKKITTSL